MNGYRAIVILLALAAATGCGQRSSGSQQAPATSLPPVTASGTSPVADQAPMPAANPGQQPEPVAGGQVDQNPQSPEIAEAARQAMAILGQQQPGLTLSRIATARTQVVAGVNYFLRLECTRNGRPEVWDVTVNRDLQRHYSVLRSARVQGGS